MGNELTKTDLKNIYHFTDKMIAEYLPNPIIVYRGIYKTKTNIWDKTVIDSLIEKNPTLKSELLLRESKYLKRSAVAKKACEIKRLKLKESIDKAIADITVQKIDDSKLELLTIENKQNWYNYNGINKNAYEVADTKVLDRWKVNYIRHELTEYDINLYECKGKVGIGEEYIRYKVAVLNKIGTVYPNLKAEINRQITELMALH